MMKQANSARHMERERRCRRASTSDHLQPTAYSLQPAKLGGFTLVEILVAIAIFVIVGTMAMAGYNELITQSDRVDQTASRTRAIQFAMLRMGQDFATLEPRAVRQPLGDELDPALRAGTGTGTDGLIELTHSGWSNPAGVPRPTLQRVAYRLNEGRLQRAYWPVIDRTMNVDPVTVVLLDRVTSVTLRFMGNDHDWKEQWPPLGYSGRDSRVVRPLAVEITLELEDWGKITRVIEVSG
jgi:general secretion pathway protein J